jgi:hypothetical protein
MKCARNSKVARVARARAEPAIIVRLGRATWMPFSLNAVEKGIRVASACAGSCSST